MGEREDRLARNEVLFRDVNERVREISEWLDPAGKPRTVDIFCECGRADCVEKLSVAMTLYEQVRSHPERFLVSTRHEEPEVERVVEKAEGYSIVEKHEEQAAIAREHDPRG